MLQFVVVHLGSLLLNLLWVRRGCWQPHHVCWQPFSMARWSPTTPCQDNSANHLHGLHMVWTIRPTNCWSWLGYCWPPRGSPALSSTKEMVIALVTVHTMHRWHGGAPHHTPRWVHDARCMQVGMMPTTFNANNAFYHQWRLCHSRLCSWWSGGASNLTRTPKILTVVAHQCTSWLRQQLDLGNCISSSSWTISPGLNQGNVHLQVSSMPIIVAKPK